MKNKLTKFDKFALNHFVKIYGVKKFFLFPMLPINYNKWSSIGKLIEIIESMDKNYSVNITKYNTTIYWVKGVAYIPIATSYSIADTMLPTYLSYNKETDTVVFAPLSELNERNKKWVVLKAIVGFCKNYYPMLEREDELICTDYYLQCRDKKIQDAPNT